MLKALPLPPPRYLNAIQQNAHHLLRYLATAVILNKRRRQMVMRELMKVIQQESYTYADPITQFLECLYIDYDFEGAQQKLKECEEVRLRAPVKRFRFLGFLSGIASRLFDVTSSFQCPSKERNRRSRRVKGVGR